MVFFAIWWAWMNFTWFASAYDCDDVLYRLAVFVQIAGALMMAGGVTAMFETRAPNMATIGGYVVMRLALVAQWLRAAASDPARRTTASPLCARHHGPADGVGRMPVRARALDSGIPHAWRRSNWRCQYGRSGVAPTTWHPHHIAERYGLLTLIVLGESILAATIAVQAALSSGEALSSLVPLIVGGLLIVYSMWWMYFDRPVHDLLTSLRKAIIWGYGHYFVFASAAAVGAGLAVSVDSRDSSRQGRECWRRSGRCCSGRGLSWCVSGFSTIGPSMARHASWVPSLRCSYC